MGGLHGGSGLNARVAGASAASSYFNPALLPDAAPGATFGLFVLRESIGISVDPRESIAVCAGGACDVPSVLGGGPESFRQADGRPIERPALPTRWLEEGRDATEVAEALSPRPRQAAGSGKSTRAYQLFGLVTRVLGDRLVLGAVGAIPLDGFTSAKAFYNDEREQFFSNSLHPELYRDRLTAPSIAFGLGSRVLDGLSLGAGAAFSFTNVAAAPVYVSNLSKLDTLLIDSDIDVRLAVSPEFGVALDPAPGLRLAATAHAPRAFRIETGLDYLLSTGIEQSSEVRFTHAFMPWMLALGGTYELPSFEGHALSFAATALFARWSSYEDRHGEKPAGGETWSDTITAGLGIRERVSDLTALLDLAYAPSPVPDQTGRKSYVDNHRGSLTAGIGYDFDLFEARAHVGARVLVHRLFPRKTAKAVPAPGAEGGDVAPVLDEVPDDAVDGTLGDPVPGREGLQSNNPGFPGFSSEGWLLGAGLELSIAL